ncbi:hypothetical protein AKJ09_05614 [Labilithrix luteola]|uniref:Tryptophan synthase alpha chain n=1 Tax=Labilithrix luteola TaxID=1391654 RepID=A0A0K1PZI8_9BACT|nr:hypothetical protein [Labilithrix luteola]AKU98950.1 hypothetical protein AKJ09_05614 [Labilithrix luteola]
MSSRTFVSTLTLALVATASMACKSTPQPTSQDPSAQPSAPPAPAAPDASNSGAKGVTCGPTTCKPGETCCNESCGICTPEGGFCTQQACLHDAGNDAASLNGPGQCNVDADCRVRSVYCKETPCACLALGKGDPNPTCAGGSVQCLVDPCLKKVAQCVSGRCVTQAVTQGAPTK